MDSEPSNKEFYASQEKMSPKWHFCKGSTEKDMISVYQARITYFGHILSSNDHFTVNEFIFFCLSSQG